MEKKNKSELLKTDYHASSSVWFSSIFTNIFAFVLPPCIVCGCVCLQALAEQQKAQQLAQQQTGAPQAQAAPGQAQAPASGQAQVPQAAAVAGAPAVPNAVLVRLSS